MGIYIKGMDFLPEDGTEFVVKKDEYGTWIKPIGNMGFSMRLIELTENHGDLIDRDALNIGDYEREDDDTGTLEISIGGLLDLYHKIKDAPKVIEAEWGEDHDE